MRKVAVVDDNADNRLIIRTILEDQYEILEFSSGIEAIEGFRKDKPDVVILDLLMPVMNGIDAARVLRLIMPRLPLIMNIASKDQLVEKEARLIGVTEIVPKSAQALVQTARRVLCSELPAAA